MAAQVETFPEMPMPPDDYFQTLETRVVRAIEVLKEERERRVSAEQKNAELSHRTEEQSAHISHLEEELSGLKRERDGVRQRIERLLGQLDEV